MILYVGGRKKNVVHQHVSLVTEAGAVKSWKSQKKDRWPMTGPEDTMDLYLIIWFIWGFCWWFGGYHGVYLIKVYKSSFGDGLLL